MNNNFQEKITFIWELADLLRSIYKRNQYQKVILPFTILKRFDSVLSDSKEAVLDTYNKYKDQFHNMDHVLHEASVDKKGKPLGYYNFSKYDFKTLLEDPENIEQKEISKYLDAELIKMDNIIKKIEEKIILMEEYKKSMIHHVVTGKVDVRGVEV